MTREELEDLQEIEKDFDKETARRVYEAGYRKVFNKYTCQRCGKEFTGHIERSLLTLNTIPMVSIRICPSCWVEFLERHIEVDNEFLKESSGAGQE